MSKFDAIIGYELVKDELKEICDMVHNPDSYERLGARMPKGLLIHGEPGLGKTLMTRAFVEECGRKSYIIRRDKPDGEIVDKIKRIFTEAAENEPSVIVLDDMDKFATEEKNTEEYVAIQACIDEVSDKDVFVIATTNDLRDIPDSLLRAGRFDRKMNINKPKREDAEKIIMHYMNSKSFIGDINLNDVSKMLNGMSCAEIETIINEAAIYAGYERQEKIEMEHIVRAVLRDKYNVANYFMTVDSSQLVSTAYHEAGHVAMAEILQPDSIGLVTLKSGEMGGMTVRCSRWQNDEYYILMDLAGKAVTEIKEGKVGEGCAVDIMNALRNIRERIRDEGVYGTRGLSLLLYNTTDVQKASLEIIVSVEFNRYLNRAKEILAQNMEFVDAIAKALLEKKVLLNSDVTKIRENCKIHDVRKVM